MKKSIFPGTSVGDKCEIDGIAHVYGHQRVSPLLVGSIKTNLGHSEAAAALTSLAKILIIFQTKIIPANLHLVNLAKKFEKYVPKYLKPVTSNTIFERGYVALNSFGVGGANFHLILEPFNNEKHNLTSSKSLIIQQYIIPLFGRTIENLEKQIDFFKSHSKKVNNEFLHLYQNISNIASMKFRSFIYKNEDDKLFHINPITEQLGKRPICFIFPGIHSGLIF